MRIENLGLGSACLIKGRRIKDERGWFEEIWSHPTLKDAGLVLDFIQDNVSHSKHVGTLRGLHYQAPPMAQGKLVRVLQGAITDVLVDIRAGSPTFGKHRKVNLSQEEPHAVWVPQGFLHGFITRSSDTLVHYKVTSAYSAAHDGAVRWDDPELGIDWGNETPILSKKDQSAPRLADIAEIFPKGSLA
ncbi:dTDP-4-dehydrorhamnose 3,5-epimerase [Maricaulaceae bacterium NA33B04]|nr:dTDP-4-dehydrorhamnose 3,5-epimerase [Maricaulaceae bacterium NA33B04]